MKAPAIIGLGLLVTMLVLIFGLSIIRDSSREVFRTRVGSFAANVSFKTVGNSRQQTVGIYRCSVFRNSEIFRRIATVQTPQLTPSRIKEVRDDSIIIIYDEDCLHFVFVIDLGSSDFFVYAIEDRIIDGLRDPDLLRKYNSLRTNDPLLPEVVLQEPLKDGLEERPLNDADLQD